ncbi:MAG: neutral zinc metallopeptidase [Kofleriaceae bacterium]
MRWDKSHESSNVDDRRSEGGARMAAGGLPLGAIMAVGSRFGWKGIVVAVLVVGAMAYGGVCTGGSMCSGSPSSQVSTQQPTSNDASELTRFVGFVLDDVQKTWSEQLKDYQPTRLVLFRNSINSACGNATAAVGPFYCPGDRKVYIDLAFYNDLRERFGAPGDFAQAYVIAHEVGHHVQNLRGKLNGNDQIAIELQADCLAGAWARDAEKRDLLEIGDMDEALNAASQIGDDTIQRKTQGRVQPETWTHGSAAQRSAALRKGHEGGAAACGIN